MHPQMRVAFVAASMLLSASSLSQQEPSCAPPGADICKVMSGPEFVSGYKEAYDQRLAPVDAVYEITHRLSQVLRGAGAAGPAAIGPQVDAALDRALDRMKGRICPPQARVNAELAATVAESFSGAGAGLGVALPPKVLGGMTGAFVSSIRPRGAACLCKATDFGTLQSAC